MLRAASEGAQVQREEGEPAGCFPLVQRKPGSAVLKMRGKSGPQRRAEGAEGELNPGKDPAAGVSEVVTIPVLIPPSTTEVVTGLKYFHNGKAIIRRIT